MVWENGGLMCFLEQRSPWRHAPICDFQKRSNEREFNKTDIPCSRKSNWRDPVQFQRSWPIIIIIKYQFLYDARQNTPNVKPFKKSSELQWRTSKLLTNSIAGTHIRDRVTSRTFELRSHVTAVLSTRADLTRKIVTIFTFHSNLCTNPPKSTSSSYLSVIWGWLHSLGFGFFYSKIVFHKPSHSIMIGKL